MIARVTQVLLLSKQMTIPRLSPTHSSARILQFLCQPGQWVAANEAVLIVECSPDLVTPGYRATPDERQCMIIETEDEGVVTELKEQYLHQWLPVNTPIGVIDEDASEGDMMELDQTVGDESNNVDGDWLWQAYKHQYKEGDNDN